MAIMTKEQYDEQARQVEADIIEKMRAMPKQQAFTLVEVMGRHVPRAYQIAAKIAVSGSQDLKDIVSYDGYVLSHNFCSKSIEPEYRWISREEWVKLMAED